MIVTAACASAPQSSGGPPLSLDHRVRAPAFSFATDTFTFANLIRARHPDEHDLYANYCFVLARGLRQFSRGPAIPGPISSGRAPAPGRGS